MSTFPNFYHYQEEPEVLLTHNVFGYGHPDAQRPKTPTSLINHTGHSPGPLSTPPLSRDASRGPDPLPDQPPGQMLYDDGFGSLSNSPTSVRTPDNDSFEVEMLETQSMRDFYQNQNGGMTTQASHGALPAIDTNMMFTAQGTLSDQGMHPVTPILLLTLTASSPSRSAQLRNGCSTSTLSSPVYHANPATAEHGTSPTVQQLLRSQLPQSAGTPRSVDRSRSSAQRQRA